MSEVSSRDTGLVRAEAAAVLVQALATANPPMDPETSQAARRVVLRALNDKSYSVRLDTVRALGDYGGEDMIPAVAEAAAADRKHKAYELSFKNFALQALGQMQARARLKVTPTSTHPKLATLLEQLQASDWQTRATAFEWIRTDTMNLIDAKVRSALIELRDRERLIGKAEKDTTYTQYVADLGGTVDTFPEANARR